LLRQAVFDPFTKETGITVVATTAAYDIAKVKAMMDSGRVEWDVIELYTQNWGAFEHMGALDVIDPAILAQAKSDIFDTSIVTPTGVPRMLYSINVWWNTKFIKGPLNGWADVFDVARFPGKRGFDNSSFPLEIALMADGVDPKKLYPLDMDRAFAKFKSIKNDVVFVGSSNLADLTAQQAVVTGSEGSLPRIQTAIKGGTPLAYTWKQAIVDPEALGVLKGAPNRANAQCLVAYSARPEVQLRVLDVLGYMPTSKAARAQVPASRGADLPGSDQTAPDAAFMSPAWYRDNGNTYDQRLQQFLLTFS
jgi:putative spermidine/putrescine transport system substrate-binding protein